MPTEEHEKIPEGTSAASFWRLATQRAAAATENYVETIIISTAD